MNSKECLEEILSMLNYEQIDECDKKGLLRTIKQGLDKLETLEKEKEWFEKTIKQWGEKYRLLEKELLQTKRNFRNSQIHSKNCYKKLKGKYTKLERAYKNNEVMARDLNGLIKEILKLKHDNEELEYNYKLSIEDYKSLKEKNTKLKQALEKACERLDYTCPVEEELIEDLNCENCKDNYKECWVKFFLKEALKNE